MKYIRTKDGRISYLTSEPNEEVPEYEIITSKGTVAYRMESQVVKIADTIAELCDVFVVENEYCGQVSQSMYSDFEKAKQNIDITSNDVIYGSLRIAGKGIIYVAKMNEKGELELL